MHTKAQVFAALLLVLSTYGMAQKNEFALTVGGATSSSQQTRLVGVTCPQDLPCTGPFNSKTNVGVAFEGVYTREVFNFHAASLGAELPFVGAPHRDVTTQAILFGPVSISQSALFFTPSARIKFLPSSAVSPFFSIGGGLARFETGGAVNRGALQVGGGVDLRTPWRHFAIRGEVRDFRATGTLDNGGISRVSPAHQNNVFAGAGVVLKF
jgi:hypothetical protein